MEESDVEFHVSLATGGGAEEGEAGCNQNGERESSNNVLAHDLRHRYGYLNGEAVGGEHDPLACLASVYGQSYEFKMIRSR